MVKAKFYHSIDEFNSIGNRENITMLIFSPQLSKCFISLLSLFKGIIDGSILEIEIILPHTVVVWRWLLSETNYVSLGFKS